MKYLKRFFKKSYRENVGGHRSYDSLIIFSIVIISIFKIWLNSSLRIEAESSQVYDDALYVRLAYHLAKGEWFGNFGNLTLIKYPFYSFWLSLNNLIGSPLLIAQTVLYVLAGIFLIYQLDKCRVNRVILLVTYLLYLFNPFVETRIMREGIYSSLIIILLGCFVGLYSHLFAGRKILLGWSMLTGIILSMYWLTREESIWMLPFIGIMILFFVNEIRKTCQKKDAIKRSAILMVPFVMLVAAINAISFANYLHYGKYCISEQNSKPFTSAVGSLLRVKHKRWLPALLVPEEVRERIYETSPAFRELKPFLDGNAGSLAQREDWKEGTCEIYPDTCNDYGGAWFYWAFRLAVADAGYYSSAPKADEFYKRVSSEIDTACDSKSLDCLPKHDSTVPPYRREYGQLLLKTYATAFRYILTVPVRYYVYNPAAYSQASPDGLLAMQEFTHNRVLPLYDQPVKGVDGYSKTDTDKLMMMERIWRCYKVAFPMMVYAALLSCLVSTMITIRRKRVSLHYILSTALLLALSLRLAILSYIDLTMFPTFTLWPSYINPFYPLTIMASGLIIADLHAKIFVDKKSSIGR